MSKSNAFADLNPNALVPNASIATVANANASASDAEVESQLMTRPLSPGALPAHEPVSPTRPPTTRPHAGTPSDRAHEKTRRDRLLDREAATTRGAATRGGVQLNAFTLGLVQQRTTALGLGAEQAPRGVQAGQVGAANDAAATGATQSPSAPPPGGDVFMSEDAAADPGAPAAPEDGADAGIAAAIAGPGSVRDRARDAPPHASLPRPLGTMTAALSAAILAMGERDPVFSRATCNIAWSGDRDPIAGMPSDGILRGIDPEQRAMFAEMDENGEPCLWVRLLALREVVGPSLAPAVTAASIVASLTEAMGGAEDFNPSIAPALQDPNSADTVAPNTFALFDIPAALMRALLASRFIIIGNSVLATFKARGEAASQFLFTIAGFTTSSVTRARNAVVRFLLGNSAVACGLRATVNKHADIPMTDPGDPLVGEATDAFSTWVANIELRPLSVISTGQTTVTHFNVFAPVCTSSAAAWYQIRVDACAMEVKTSLIGIGKKVDKYWQCLTCSAGTHMQAKCPVHELPFWPGRAAKEEPEKNELAASISFAQPRAHPQPGIRQAWSNGFRGRGRGGRGY